MYRSKDKEFMDHVKTNVLQVTRGKENDVRKFAVDYLRTHVKIDDLHQLACKKFPGKIIAFGEGSYQPIVVVVTKDKITKETKQKLNTAFSKIGLTEDHTYYTHLRFVKTKKKAEERQDILNKLIHMLHPAYVLLFDGIEIETDIECSEGTLPIQCLENSDMVDERKKLTQVIKEIKKYF